MIGLTVSQIRTGSIASSLNVPEKFASVKKDRACFRNFTIELQKVRKKVHSFLTAGSTPKLSRTKSDALRVIQKEQRRAEIAGSQYRSRPMSSVYTIGKSRGEPRPLKWFARKVSRLLLGPTPRPELTEHGCMLREDFKTAAMAAVHAQADKLRRSKSREPLSMDDVSSLMKKFDDLYTCEFATEVDSLLRKYVSQKKSWTISALLWEAHHQIFGKAVNEIGSQITETNRRETVLTSSFVTRKENLALEKWTSACKAKMWELFDGASVRIGTHFNEPDGLPNSSRRFVLTEVGRKLRDDFMVDAIGAMRAAYTDALRESAPNELLPEEKLSSQVKQLLGSYTDYFAAEVDALLPKYVAQKETRPISSVFWKAHRVAFRKAATRPKNSSDISRTFRAM